VHPWSCLIFCFVAFRVASNALFLHQKFSFCWLSVAVVVFLCFFVAGPPGLLPPLLPPPPLLPLVALPPSPPVHAPVCLGALGVLEDGVNQDGIGLHRLFGQPEFLYGGS